MEEEQLLEFKRYLEPRHLQMISIGGTIGTGLFVASGATISLSGPLGALLGYMVCAMMVYPIVTSIGELALAKDTPGTFNTYASDYVDDALSFSLGWNYFLQWAISLPSELSAAGLILSYWNQDIPPWIFSACILLLLTFVNILGVKGFGETEYVLSMIKVLAIIVFIVVGILLDLGSFSEKPLYFEYWTIPGAPFKSFLSVFQVFVIAFFGFGGTELVGIAAGETINPQENVPKAVNGTFWRILLFYIGSILVMGLVIRNDDPSLLNAAASGDITIAPYTLVFHRAGWTFAAHLMNAVILSAVLSAGNSAIYAASRTLYALSKEGKAPSIFQHLDKRSVPIYSVLCCTLVGFVSFFGIYYGNGQLFSVLLQITGGSGIMTWMSIAWIHYRYRKATELQSIPLVYRAPFFPYGSIVAVCLGTMILIGQGFACKSALELLNVYCTKVDDSRTIVLCGAVCVLQA
ncbi:amino acid permease/ SLC12A domain-containing protein [Gorgonomyces haynaldii]|nr:amino acid permease/ SLC12A domain-containing protein [Gorgonomyces haynaldii]